MRVIEQQLLDAIRNHKDWRSSNTSTECTYFAHGDRVIDRITVYLHNNPIAFITPTDVTICDCGWQTPTTKSRLNVILHALCGAGVYQKNHKWFGTAIEEQDWEIELNSRHCFVRFR
jgi:hypothetical protein